MAETTVSPRPPKVQAVGPKASFAGMIPGLTMGVILALGPIIWNDLTQHGALRWTTGLACIGILGFVLRSVWLTSVVIREQTAMIEMTDVAQRLARGDYTLTSPPRSVSREAQALGVAIAGMAEAMRRQAKALRDAVQKVLENSAEVMSASTQLAGAAAEQASAIAESTAGVEEVKQAGHAARENAGHIVTAADASIALSGEGMSAVNASTAEMERIRGQVERIATGVESLRAQVGEVGEIILMVGQVAEQSNLLAVNAAIEAAKAGAAGRGFAVVAQEVKALAAQSKEATDQVRLTLGRISAAIEEVFDSAVAGKQRVEAGVTSIATTGAAIRRLSEMIGEANNIAKRIAISANEQVVGLEQVAMAMAAINQGATENRASAEQMQHGSERLATMARDLEEHTKQVRLPSEDELAYARRTS